MNAGPDTEAEERGRRLAVGVAWTAHEMRGPILGVRSALEVLLGRTRDERDAGLLRAALTELERLSDTADALLDSAAGTRGLRMGPCDVVALVREAADAARLESGEDRIVVHAPPMAIAHADPTYLRVAIVNLIRNALRYSDPGTKVEVTIDAGERGMDLSVTNEGPGISEAERHGIFAPFVRGASVGDGDGGRGLGLFIARRAVEAHGGRVWLDPLGPGTTFRITLPAEAKGWRRCAS